MFLLRIFLIFGHFLNFFHSVRSEPCGPNEFAIAVSVDKNGIIDVICDRTPCYIDSRLPTVAPICTGATQNSCPESSQLVAGVRSNSDIFMPLSLVCCTSQRLIGSKRVGLAIISIGSFYRGGAVADDDGRLVGFDVIKNLRRDVGPKTEDVVLLADIHRLQCLALPPEITNFVAHEVFEPPPPVPVVHPVFADAPQVAAGPACFTKDVTVQTKFGAKTMQEIQIGDIVLSVVNNKPAFVKITSFMHRIPDKLAKFQKIVTDGKFNLTLTPYHFVFVAACHPEKEKLVGKQMKYAKDVIPGQDCLLSVNADGISSQKVTVVNNSVFYERGIFSPMTENGVIVTNGYMSSCHSILKNDGFMTSFIYWIQKLQRSIDWIFSSSKVIEENQFIELPWIVSFALNSANKVLEISKIFP